MFCIPSSLFYSRVYQNCIAYSNMLMLCNGHKININVTLSWEGNLKFTFLKVFVIKPLGLFGRAPISYNPIF